MHAYTVRFIDRIINQETKEWQMGITMPKGIKVLRAGELDDHWSPRSALGYDTVIVGSYAYQDSSFDKLPLMQGVEPEVDGRIYQCTARKSRKNERQSVIDRVDPATADHALVMLEGFLEATSAVPQWRDCYHRNTNGFFQSWVNLADNTCCRCGLALNERHHHPNEGVSCEFYYLTHMKPNGVELWGEGTKREITRCSLVSLAPGTMIRLVARAHDGKREFILKCRTENGETKLAYSNLVAVNATKG